MIAENSYLLVDLERDLLASDLRAELFWAGVARRWQRFQMIADGSVADRDATDVIDAALLPLRDDTVLEVRRWRAEGGKTVLVSQGRADLADQISAQLGIFDDVIDRDQVAAHTSAALGQTSLPERSWPRLPGGGDLMVALRPHQWVKNLLVFVPALAAHDLTAETLIPAFAAFVAFCLASSGTYLLNDLLDLAADRVHPRKRNRPFASGRLSLAAGTVVLTLAMILALAVALVLGPGVALALMVYLVTAAAYSLVLKRLPVIDICTLAALYTIRIVVGGAATGIPLSIWLVLFSIFFFFSLAAVKRQGELVDLLKRGENAAAGRGYIDQDLPIVEIYATASGFVSVVVLALFLNSANVGELYANPKLLWGSIPILLYWTARIVFLTRRGLMHDDPIIFAARDGISRACLFLLVLLFAGAVGP